MHVVLPVNFWCGNQLQVLLFYVKERSSRPSSSVSCSHNTEQLELGSGAEDIDVQYPDTTQFSLWVDLLSAHSDKPIERMVFHIRKLTPSITNSFKVSNLPPPTGHSALCGEGVLFLRGGAARGQRSETHLVEWNQAPNQ